MDILVSEREKRLMRFGVLIFRKKIGKNADDIEKYLRSSNDNGFNEILDVIDYTYDNTIMKYQGRTFKQYIHLALFIAVNHPKIKRYLRKGLQLFTKYDKINIDLKPCLSKFDIYIVDKMMSYMIKKFSEKPTYMAILGEAYITGNEIGRYFTENMTKISIGDDDETLKGTLLSFAWLGIWIGLNDTAYRHQFYYAVNKIGNDDLQKMSKIFCFEPDKWYINIYKNATDRTKELWNNNEIPRHQNSLIEEPCVVKKQQEKFRKHAEKYGVV